MRPREKVLPRMALSGAPMGRVNKKRVPFSMPHVAPCIRDFDEIGRLLPLRLPQRVGEGSRIAGAARGDAEGVGEREEVGVVQIRVAISLLVLEALLMLDPA